MMRLFLLQIHTLIYPSLSVRVCVCVYRFRYSCIAKIYACWQNCFSITRRSTTTSHRSCSMCSAKLIGRVAIWSATFQRWVSPCEPGWRGFLTITDISSVLVASLFVDIKELLLFMVFHGRYLDPVPSCIVFSRGGGKQYSSVNESDYFTSLH